MKSVRRPRISASLLVAWLCVGAEGQILQRARLAEDEGGTAVFHIMDAYGHGLKPTKVEIKNIETGASFSCRVTDSVTCSLPYGDYKVRVLVPGFRYWLGDIHIAQPHLRITIGMQLGSIEGPTPSCALSGQLTGLDYSPGKAPWIRLMPIFANEIFEADVAADGRFKVANAECGDYVLVVMRERTVLKTLSIQLTGHEQSISVSVERPEN